MATPATLISGWIKKYRWIGWVGLLAILDVAIKEILTTKFLELCFVSNIFDIRMDIPIDDNMMTEIEPNTSNLTNAELK